MVTGKVVVKNVLGGLAPDSDAPMPNEMRGYIRGAWQSIETVVPGTEFNYDFWQRCEPRRSTYPACRAVIAARMQGKEYEEAMTTAIQHAYYREARNPSLVETLVDLASEIGLDANTFIEDLASDQCEQTLQEEIALTRSLGAKGFPSLIMLSGQKIKQIDYDYNDADATVGRIVGAAFCT
jgi:putative protein-disulfide isomerase